MITIYVYPCRTLINLSILIPVSKRLIKRREYGLMYVEIYVFKKAKMNLEMGICWLVKRCSIKPTDNTDY